jgi:hypothetical protein
MAKNVTTIKTENTSVRTVTETKLVTGFDYTTLDPDAADFLRQAANQIRSCREGMAREIIRMGMTLHGAKAHLLHGQFGPWLKAEFNMSERTAENYMSVAKEFGNKSETVADLPLKLLYGLAAPSTPKQIREKVVADLEAGKTIDHRAITKEISVSRKGGSLDKLQRAEEAAHEAALILAKLPPEERQELLRLLDTPRIRSFLDDAILKCEKARARSGDCEDEYKAALTYCASIHEMGGPGRRRSISIHDVPESEVVK